MENINFYIALFSNESYETFNVAFIKMFMMNFLCHTWNEGDDEKNL